MVFAFDMRARFMCVVGCTVSNEIAAGVFHEVEQVIYFISCIGDRDLSIQQRTQDCDNALTHAHNHFLASSAPLTLKLTLMGLWSDEVTCHARCDSGSRPR